MKELLEELKRNSKNKCSFANCIRFAIKKNSELLDEIKEQTKFLDEHYNVITLSQRIHHIWTGEGIQFCPICGVKGRIAEGVNRGIFTGYNDTCGKECQIAKSRATNLERHGVENPGQSEVVKSKIRATNLKRYGVEYGLQSEVVKSKFRATNLERHGVEYALQSEVFKLKFRATNLERHGVEYAGQSEVVKSKIRATNLKRYGVEYGLQSEVVKEKSKATNLKNLGVENPMHSEVVKEKSKATNLKIYGVENPFQSEVIKAKIIAANLKNLGVGCSLQSEVVRAKGKETNLKNLGVENPMQSEFVRAKCIATNLKNLGVEYPSQSEVVKSKMRATNFNNYGVENPMHNIDIFKKCQKAMCNKKHYALPSGTVIYLRGYEHIYLDNYFANDLPESDIQYEPFNIHYSLDGLKHKYYPDFFIYSKNLIIEVKSTWTFNKDFDENLAKRQACLDAGYNFEFYIYDERGNRLDTEQVIKDIEAKLYGKLA